MISALNRLPDSTIELTIIIPWKRVEVEFQKTLTELAQKTTVRGFRKGKAPLKKVEGVLGKAAIKEEVIKTLIPAVYIKAIHEHHIKPIVNPIVSITSLDENKDWQIKAVTCELPKVDLEGYQGEVKKALAAEKIWVPGKDKEEKDSRVFQALLNTVKIQVPEILIQEEVNRMLSRLIDQTARLGLTVEQYLVSVKKTSEQLREEYHRQALDTLKLEFILSAIADDQKIEIPETEVDKMLQTIPDEASKKSLSTPEGRVHIRQLLRKRQAIDNLSQL